MVFFSRIHQNAGENNAMKTIFIVLFSSLLTFSSFGETPTYTETENTGLNKKERIDSIEKYLTDLANSIKKMETKFQENTTKLKDLEEIVNSLKKNEEKAASAKLGENAKPVTMPEFQKLKTDLEALKNKDIEKLKSDIDVLSNSIFAIQGALKNPTHAR
jgi:peptidoglycan hydrolase CwlO-like protein